MKFYSTNNTSHRVSLREAVLRGLSPDNGLYMPEIIRQLDERFFRDLPRRSMQDTAFLVAGNLLGDEIPAADLRALIDRTITFPAPLVRLDKNIHILELFHGPTMAFKDFGARFMSQLLGYFAAGEDRTITILVATSGDTGSAVANGFLGVEGTRVVVLYPSGKVSPVQEKQFTTLGRNITALEVNGTFDDCQRLVKTAFQDQDLRRVSPMTSANSINIARLIPQTFYYFEAFARMEDKDRPVVVSVPCGNLGNLTSGVLAKRMGLPVSRFIVSTNANDVIPKFMLTNLFDPRPSVQTISNAMDVGNPSNFARLTDLYAGRPEDIRRDIKAWSFSDAETEDAMKEVFRSCGYVMDPHGAVAYLGARKFLHDSAKAVNAVFLETAHPAKFSGVVERVLDQSIEMPAALMAFEHGTKHTIRIENDFRELKQLLMALP